MESLIEFMFNNVSPTKVVTNDDNMINFVTIGFYIVGVTKYSPCKIFLMIIGLITASYKSIKIILIFLNFTNLILINFKFKHKNKKFCKFSF